MAASSAALTVMYRMLLVLAGLLSAPAALAAMNELDATIDLRAVATNAEPSFLDGGLGVLRFDDQHRGLRIGELRLGYMGQFANIVHINVEAVSYADGDRLPLDLTEAFAEIRPYPWQRLALEPENRRFLRADLVRESPAGLAQRLRFDTIGNQFLDRRGAAHDRRRIRSRLAGSPARPRLGVGSGRRHLWLE